MMTIKILVSAVLLLVRSVWSSEDLSPALSDSTVMLIEIYTSGSRSPVNSNIFNETWVKEVGLGRITGNGMRQQFNQGMHIRSTHKTFIESIKNFDQVRVYSSGRSRSLISAVSHNHGLFPSGSRWNPDNQLDEVTKTLTRLPPMWKTRRNIKTSLRAEFFSEPVAIPLDTVDQFHDFIFLPRIDKSCPKAKAYRDTFRAAHLNQELYQLDEFIKELHREVSKLNKSLAAQLSTKEGYVNNTNMINHLYDVLTASKYETGSLPQNFSETTYDKLRMAASGYFMLKFEQDEIRRLYTTKIAEIIVAEIAKRQRAIESNNVSLNEETVDKGLAYLGFSGDDDTVASFLHMFGLTSSRCHFNSLIKQPEKPAGKDRSSDSDQKEACHPIPPFSSTLIFELVYNPRERTFLIKPSYNHRPLFPESFKGDGIPAMPVDIFVDSITGRAFLDNFDELCGNKHVEILKRGSYGILIFLLLLGICIARSNVLGWARKEKARQDKVK